MKHLKKFNESSGLNNDIKNLSIEIYNNFLNKKNGIYKIQNCLFKKALFINKNSNSVESGSFSEDIFNDKYVIEIRDFRLDVIIHELTHVYQWDKGMIFDTEEHLINIFKSKYQLIFWGSSFRFLKNIFTIFYYISKVEIFARNSVYSMNKNAKDEIEWLNRLKDTKIEDIMSSNNINNDSFVFILLVKFFKYFKLLSKDKNSNSEIFNVINKLYKKNYLILSYNINKSVKINESDKKIFIEKLNRKINRHSNMAIRKMSKNF